MFSKFRHAEAGQSPVPQAVPAEEMQLQDAPREADATGTSAPLSDAVQEADLPSKERTPDAPPPDGADQGVTSAAEAWDVEVSDNDSGVSGEEKNAPLNGGEQVDQDAASPAGDTASMTGSDEETAPEQASVPSLGQDTRPRRRSRARALAKSDGPPQRASLTGAHRLLLLDTWRRSGLPAGDFADLVGISKHTLYKWKHDFQEFGPAGLQDQPRRHAVAASSPS